MIQVNCTSTQVLDNSWTHTALLNSHHTLLCFLTKLFNDNFTINHPVTFLSTEPNYNSFIPICHAALRVDNCQSKTQIKPNLDGFSLKLSRDSLAQAESEFTVLWSFLPVWGFSGRGPQNLNQTSLFPLFVFASVCVRVCVCASYACNSAVPAMPSLIETNFQHSDSICLINLLP